MLSMLTGWRTLRVSATSAAAVTCAIMKPELTPRRVRNGRQAAHLGSIEQRDATLGDGADFRARDRQTVGGEGHRLGVEIAAGHGLLVSGEEIGLSVTALASMVRVPRRACMRSRHAPITCGWQRRQ